MSWLMLEYLCPCCGERFESLESRGNTAGWLTCPDESCGAQAAPVISATHSGTVYGAAATTGKSDPPPPWAMDTRAIADGRQSPEQWRVERREKRRASQRHS